MSKKEQECDHTLKEVDQLSHSTKKMKRTTIGSSLGNEASKDVDMAEVELGSPNVPEMELPIWDRGFNDDMIMENNMVKDMANVTSKENVPKGITNQPCDSPQMVDQTTSSNLQYAPNRAWPPRNYSTQILQGRKESLRRGTPPPSIPPHKGPAGGNFGSGATGLTLRNSRLPPPRGEDGRDNVPESNQIEDRMQDLRSAHQPCRGIRLH
ncbi:hypothetical protein Cgig2_030789 [Carnegiea gigantea]|uniref:Uncharacterized protein n=1 Tax=Carnegiea gigantea TaxID=171969 RepID=A0A9Q1QN67_9CARY|nr:hypothetical protein Cgig2_030789 [Carnegiea gigantea]